MLSTAGTHPRIHRCMPHETVADFSIKHCTWPRGQPRGIYGGVLEQVVRGADCRQHRAPQHSRLPLIRRYWKPVYCYLRSTGCGEEDAKDFVQEFFAACLRNDFFDKADPALGRFRNFLLSALKHFVANARRAELAKKRHPTKGFAFIDDSAFAEEHAAALKHTETPD